MFRVGEGEPLVTQPAGSPSSQHFVAVAADAAAAHFESDQLARDALLLLLRKRVAADEIAFVELDDPAEVGFERRDGGVDLVPVERHLGFQAQRVARAQAAGLDAEFRAGLENLVPEARRLRGRDVDFESVFAGVAGARDARRHCRATSPSVNQ